MTKEWHIQINGNEEGPYSYWELEVDSRLTPDTLVWKQGFKSWVRAGSVPELDALFKDKRPLPEIIRPFSSDFPEPDDTLTLEYTPRQWWVWILIVLLVLMYALYRMA